MDKFGLFFRWRRRDEEIIKTIKERKKERLSLSLYLKKKKKYSSFSSFDHYFFFFFFFFSYGSIYLSIY
jgi:hypothetical protein